MRAMFLEETAASILDMHPNVGSHLPPCAASYLSRNLILILEVLDDARARLAQ